MGKTAIIIGAGPAGLTAAYELLERTDITPIILEKSGDIGGISKTVNYKGNRIDIGGHRFFSKSDRVMRWWLKILPLHDTDNPELELKYRGRSKKMTADMMSPGQHVDGPDKVMLVRKRLSRIFFLRKFFHYPIQLSFDTLSKLGFLRTAAILISYFHSRLFPRRPEKNLEDFMINRFGSKLYHLFFKDYTEKIWGVPCTQISPEWGAQRIKGISIGKAIAQAVRSIKIKQSRSALDISQKNKETSLIEQFLYPKFGPGQLWEEVARLIQEMGGRILLNQQVTSIHKEGYTIKAVGSTDSSHTAGLWEGDYFFSTMPVQELIGAMNEPVPENVQEISNGLQYRDFITVGVLLRKLSGAGSSSGEGKCSLLPDTWIYIQEKDVKVGRLQIFNNWSPFMVKDPDTVWVGMEYFCNKTDALWRLSDRAIQSMAIKELDKIGLALVEDVLDCTVLRMEKTYPAYFGTYDRFQEIRDFTDRFTNLFLIGRNGMHKYNNSDHSMLTAMVAVDNICAGVMTKDNIWAINTEQEYHEEQAKGEVRSVHVNHAVCQRSEHSHS
ncbi:MAG TPA: NAD(P)/FAD-dependent oxidoreductase [Puia sp.]|nr:NAD(P)/FAD-dependent oxidoreductase [Puia sp.]